ncbi:MAG: flagellar basal-body rod protein FlgG [Bdellovibrionales bacterium]|nr:flagellar basal-body rod protein FlgG [Bdellovibrionales bacterium]
MLKTLNTAATGMKAQQTNMDVISNNMANVNTVGFKKSRAEFEDLLYQTDKEPGEASGLNSVSPAGVQTGLGVKTQAIQKDFETGSPRITNNPLDVMIEGKGFFQIQLPDGGTGYTRNGAFKRSAEGRLVDGSGYPVVPEIVIPSNASGIEVEPFGKVLVTIGNAINQPQEVGQLELAYFVNPTGLRSLGRNLFSSTPASGQPQVEAPGQNSLGMLAQGQLESSNVNIVDEMVNMITAQRSYETNSKAIQAADQMLQTVNTLR